MAVLTFNGESFDVDHAVKGADYVHGYSATGDCIISIEGITDFSAVNYSGTYLTPEKCFAEDCNEVRYVDGKLIRKDGTEIETGGGGGEPTLLRGPILITETQTVDLSVWGIEVGDPINVICVGGGGGGGANQGVDATGTISAGFGAGKQGAPSSYYSSKYHAAGGGGGSGYVTYKSMIVDKLKVAVTIGAEGENGKSRTTPVESWTPGEAGGTTSFGSYLSAAGGNGGGGGISTASNSSTTVSGAAGGAGGNHGQRGTSGTGSGNAGGAGGEGFVPREPFSVDSSGVSGVHTASGCVMIWY